MQIQQWSQEDAEFQVQKRLKEALEYRGQFEPGWIAKEQIIFSQSGSGSASMVTYSYDSLSELFGGSMDSGDSEISINYAFKYLRFLHAQMSANPPSVIAKPTSQDHDDRQAARAAGHLVEHLRKEYRLQEHVDLTSLQSLTYGTGFMKTVHDPHAGDLLKVDKETGDIVMTGDLRARPLLIWDVALDPNARCWEDVRYVFERHILSVEEASFRWPDHKELFENMVRKNKADKFFDRTENGKQPSDRVAVWEYVEKALPWNGMAGRRVFLVEDGPLLSDLQKNPCPNGALPYHVLTDVDVPGQVYGKTFLDYIVRLQDVLNRLDSTILDNIQAHGTVRMVVYDAAEQQDDAPSNSGWQVMNIRGTAAQAPTFIPAPQLMPDIYKFREQLLTGMEALAGTNESMFGQQSREMSGFAQQTNINAGNMTRRRLYNKYQMFVQSVFEQLLGLIQKHWDTKRKVRVTGEEGALQIAYYDAASIESGYDLEVEYGASFSLDPASRREEIMQLMPMLKEAGFSMREILGMMRINDVGGLFDVADMAARRQLEIVDEMIAKYEQGTPIYIDPEEKEEHPAMLDALNRFRQSMAFKVLDEELKILIERHMEERENMAAAQAAGPAGAAPPPGAQVPEMGLPGVPPGALGGGPIDAGGPV